MCMRVYESVLLLLYVCQCQVATLHVCMYVCMYARARVCGCVHVRGHATHLSLSYVVINLCLAMNCNLFQYVFPFMYMFYVELLYV